MNERINELFYEAEHSVNQVFVWDPTGPEREDVIREKFAELIVRECYLWSKENGGLGCEEDFEALKEHFGVEP
jgi:hypothetical protein